MTLAADLYFAGRLAFARRPDVRLCTREGEVVETRAVTVPGAPRAGRRKSRVTGCAMLVAEGRRGTVGVGLVAEDGDDPALFARALLAHYQVAETRDDERLRRAGLASLLTGGGHSGWEASDSRDLAHARHGYGVGRRVRYFGVGP